MPTYQVTSLQDWRAQECRNIFYYVTSDVLDSTQLQDIADHFRASYATLDATDVLDNDWAFLGVEVRRVDVADLPSQTVIPSLGQLQGSHVAGPGVPNQVAMLASLYAPTQSPRRARTYQAGLVAAVMQHDGEWTLGSINAFGDFIEDVDTIVVTGDTLLRHAVEWGSNPSVVVDTNRLETYIVRRNPATQRRRRLGSGI